MSNPPSQFDPKELYEWQQGIEAANRHNVFCHCRRCGQEWVASAQVVCACGSREVEYIICWQFPDD